MTDVGACRPVLRHLCVHLTAFARAIISGAHKRGHSLEAFVVLSWAYCQEFIRVNVGTLGHPPTSAGSGLILRTPDNFHPLKLCRPVCH